MAKIFHLTILILFIGTVSLESAKEIMNGQQRQSQSDLKDNISSGRIQKKKHLNQHLLKGNESSLEMIGGLIRQIHGTDTFLLLENNLRKIPGVQQKCFIAALSILYDTIIDIRHGKNIMTLPLAKMIDAWGKVLPNNLLLGNFMWMGSYGECSGASGAKYCMTPIQIKNAPTGTMILYGSCFPQECSVSDVGEVMNLFKVSKLVPLRGLSKCDEPHKFSTGAVVTIAILCFIMFLNFLGTLMECMLSQSYSLKNKNSKVVMNREESSKYAQNFSDLNIGEEKNQDGQLENAKSSYHNYNVDLEREDGAIEMTKIEATSDIAPTAISSTFTSDVAVKQSWFAEFVLCFSLQKNIKSIMSTKQAKGNITSINGIRVLSMMWVVLGHYYAFNVLKNRPDNIITALQVTHRLTFQAVANAYVAVDTFFLLSGLLFSYLTLKKLKTRSMRLRDVPLLYVHRYIRLTPTLLLIILFSTYLHFTRGPVNLVNEIEQDLKLAPSSDNCKTYWWSTLLYINNIYPDNNKNCYPLAWYLANDFQFYAISPFIIMIMMALHRSTHQGKGILRNSLFIFALCFISMLVTGIITGVYNLPVLLTAALLPNNPRVKNAIHVMDYLYTKPYTRITPYLVGLLLGYILNNGVTLNQKRHKNTIVRIGWLVAAALAILVVYGPYSVFKSGGSFFSDGENIMYSATHRFVWSCAVAWAIFACHNKYGGCVDTFLSWKVWIPISRLTYGGYLVHMLVLKVFTRVAEVPYHYQDTTAVQGYISIIVVTYLFAFLLAALVEYPVMNLEKMMFR